MIQLYNTEHLNICASQRTPFSGSPCYVLLFSFHHECSVPQRLISGLYNCSVEDYWRFKQHVDCNMKVECDDGRDETEHCPFSSPECQGWVSAGHKCYKLFTLESPVQIRRGRDICREHGLQMASVKTEHETGPALTLLSDTYQRKLFGLTCSWALKPFMYRWFLVWSDKTVVYNANHIVWQSGECEKGFHFRLHERDSKFRPLRDLYAFRDVVCEKYVQKQDRFVSQSVDFSVGHKSLLSFQGAKSSFVTCPAGHLTHAFLSCDRKSRCGQAVCYFTRRTSGSWEVVSDTKDSAEIASMYSCRIGETEVPYSLLCDFRQDCADNSDESFCYHPLCTEFTCTNGQCVSVNKHCNNQTDCLDDSDEKDCPEALVDIDHHSKNNSFLINLDGSGYFTQSEMNITDPCPDTHYRCTKEWFYCLPIYTRCNGVFDCVFQEDERDCEGWTCPGLYRCRDSTVCVHADHMCDGWPQCPQRDDEWLCDITCPVQCLCQGHAFLCPQPFSAHLFPQLRYLDARWSGMTPFDLSNNTYIVRLRLVQCSISSLTDVKLLNLQFLDLGYNEIESVHINVFTNFKNLQVLILRGNPLTGFTMNTLKTSQSLLQRLDLSETNIGVFDSSMLPYAPRMQYINISYSSIHSIATQFFEKVPRLKELDMRGNMVNDFPTDLFLGLNDLEAVYTSDHRLCCDKNLPSIVPKPICLAPKHYLSSCDDMLQSEVYRLNFWFVAVLASLANLFCFVCHCAKSFIQIPYRGSVAVVMASLQCADFCMGIYASVIATAHETFHGQYVRFERGWSDSVACTVAGFFSLLSIEVSTLSIFLLTLEHLILLHFPHSRYRFSKGSAAVACGVTWLVGIFLASTPLLHSGHYGRTAVCSRMLHERRNVSQQFQPMHAILVFNVFICVTVFVCQIIIYRKIPKYRILTEENTNPAHASVDMLMKIAAIDVARWIGVTTSGVCALAGVAGMQINVFMVITVLTLNSAVNPLVCLWHAETYRQRIKQEERLLRVLKSRSKCVSHTTVTHRKETN